MMSLHLIIMALDQKKNTTDCLVDLLEQITNNVSDNGEFALTHFLDLSKVFDTVNHFILLSKLSYYGIVNLENLWFKSYLQQRRQAVYVNAFFFPGIQVINLGVPQGYVLGSILFFLLFILLILAVPPHTFPHASLLRILHSLYVA